LGDEDREGILLGLLFRRPLHAYLVRFAADWDEFTAGGGLRRRRLAANRLAAHEKADGRGERSRYGKDAHVCLYARAFSFVP
jgi:hypothetical protein